MAATNLKWQRRNNIRIIVHFKMSKRRDYQIHAYVYTPRRLVYPTLSVQFFMTGKAERKRQCSHMQKRNTEARSCNHCYHEKAKSITYSECVFVALCIQHVNCTRPVTVSSVACIVLQIFPHYLIMILP
jgi:hypothetical protein